MKLPVKLIIILILASLLGIFVYQTYWLTGLYTGKKKDAERSILEAMRMSDFNELVLRVKILSDESSRPSAMQHGSISVSANSGKKKDTVTVSVQRGDSTTHVESSVQATGENAFMLKAKEDIESLVTYLQQGLHSGVDMLIDPNIEVYDSLLTARLKEAGLDFPHRLEYLHQGATIDSTYIYTDTLAVRQTPADYHPSAQAKQYTYTFDLHSNHLYRLTLEPFTGYLLKQMSGILASSLAILLIITAAFGVLVRIILKQKTLDEMKSDFTNNITHELKTPIAVAFAANDALLNFDKAADKQVRDRYLRICHEQLQRLSELVEQILSMSMERRKNFSLQIETVSVCDVLTGIIEQQQLKADKHVTITTDVEPNTLTVHADRTHFGNLLSNLIENAVKYSRERADITVRARLTESDEVEISVSDSGIGIAPERLPHIFDKFYRVPTGNVQNVRGYGLGLYYVKTLAEHHGGSIRVKSEVGKGSTFTLTLPNHSKQPHA